jgi:hypothetical protein
MSMLDATLARPLPTLSRAPPPPDSHKVEREAHGHCGNIEYTDNFAVKWGNSQDVDKDAVEALAASFEYIWSRQVDDMGHPAPWGTSQYLMNVYIGDTGTCAPSAMGMAGYYTTDPDGMPMIVMSYGNLWDVQYAESTAAHEFYHAVQHASEAYGSDDARWYWEATACWIEDEVFDTTTNYASFLFGYAFQPHRQLNAFTYPSAGRIEEYHQYGAFIFPRYISEHRADWTVIRDSWIDGSWVDDPVQELAALMPEEDFEALFGDFAAHNAGWNYADGDAFEADLDYWSENTSFGHDDHRIVDTVDHQGTSDEWQQAAADTLPERFGYNVIALRSPADRDLIVRFEGDETGSEGSAARYQVRLVRDYGDAFEYTPVALDGTTGELDAGSVGDEGSLYLVVAAFSDGWNEGETFDYQFQLDMGEIAEYEGSETPPPFMQGDDAKACGCTAVTAQRSLGWLSGFLLIGAGWSRRR